jgi:alkyldihydroxyacetonephosphate synthase
MTTQSAARRAINVELLNRLRDVVGGKRVSRSELEGVAYSRDMQTASVLETRNGHVARRPDFVVWPESTEEVSRILRLCNEVRMPVTPFGGGTGLDGDAAPDCGGVVLDMKRMNRLERISELSCIGVCQPGIIGAHLEHDLNRQGYTLGHFPGSLGSSTLGGWLSTRGAGMAATTYGKIEDMVVSLQVVLADGAVLHTRTAPRRATGPDFNHLFIGSEGALGVITRAHMRIHLLPEARYFRGLAFKTLEEGLTALRLILRAGMKPSFLRLADEADVATNLKALGVNVSGCLLALVFDGRPTQVDLYGRKALEICRQNGGRDHGEEPARVWCEHRYAEFYRQSPVFEEAGGVLEHLEAAAVWRDAAAVHRAVREATPGDVELLANVPHAYPEGCGFLFTMVGKADNGDAAAFVEKTRNAALAAARGAGAVVSRSHGAAKGRGKTAADPAREILLGVKKRLDPNQILNPGAFAVDPEKPC